MSDYPVDPNKIWVLDFEVDNNNDTNRAFSATPFFDGNNVVNMCWEVIFIDPDTGNIRSDRKVNNCVTGKGEVPIDIGDRDHHPWLLCGHNIKYDIQFVRKSAVAGGEKSYDGQLIEAIKDGETLLWDTQFAEYMLTGQETKMISLNNLADRYGLGSKHDEVKEMWDAGYKTRDIDPDILDAYVEQDVKLTGQIALRQIALAHERELLDFMLVQMRSLFVISEYEWNGMYVDKSYLEDLEHEAWLQKNTSAEFALNRFLMIVDNNLDFRRRVLDESGLGYEALEGLLTSWFDINSADKLKRILFGGPIEIEYSIIDGTYKSGKKKGETKYKKEKHEDYLEPITPLKDVPFEFLTPKGQEHKTAASYKHVSVDDRALDYFLSHTIPGTNVHDMIGYIKEYRDNHKLETTYCKQIGDYLFDNQLIHCNLNPSKTPTGRLTSSNPNMQNMPSKDDSELKGVFCSRFFNGKIATVDFKQLEVVGLAYLSGDTQLIDDIMSRRDIHDETGKEAGLYTTGGMSHDVRRDVKGINFGTIYGAGVEKLSHQSGLSKSDVRNCVNALKRRYPRAFGKEFVEMRERELDLEAQRVGRDDMGLMRYGNMIRQPTGRMIWIETQSSYDYPKGMMEQTWPYTCLRNYPVQSIAADIVSIARIMFYEEIRGRGLEKEILMVNEVHDEIVFDLDYNVDNALFGDIVDTVEEDLGKVLNLKFNLEPEFTLPLKLEVGIGLNWKEAK